MRVFAFLLLFLSCSYIKGQDSIRFPNEPLKKVEPSPSPQPVPDSYKMDKGELFVIDSDVECFFRMFPDSKGLTYSKEDGPLPINGVFVGGNGKRETRKFKGKFVYIFESNEAVLGKYQLIVVPKGAAADLDIKTKTIEVMSGGVTPLPPPLPKPPPVIPPKPDVTKASNVEIIICENPQARTIQQGQVINDLVFRGWVRDNGHLITMMSIKDPAYLSGGFNKYADETGLPSIIVVNRTGTGTKTPLVAFKLPASGQDLINTIEKVVSHE